MVKLKGKRKRSSWPHLPYGTTYDVGYELSDFNRPKFSFPPESSVEESKYFVAYLMVQRSGEVNMFSSTAVGIRMKAIMGITDDEFLRQKEKNPDLIGRNLDDHLLAAARSFADEKNYIQMEEKYPDVQNAVMRGGATFDEIDSIVQKYADKRERKRKNILLNMERQKAKRNRGDLMF